MKNHSIIRLTFFLCLINLCTKLIAQDIIKKTDGSEIKAKVLEISKTDVKYKKFDYPDGPTVVLPVEEINLIKYPNGTTDNFNKQNTSTNSTSNPTIAHNGFTDKEEAKNFKDANGLKQGKWIEYMAYDSKFKLIDLPNQVSAAFYRLVIYKDGNFIETERLYDISGKLNTETPYIDGRGINKTFYKNGKIQNEIPLTNGKIHGVWKMFYEDGHPLGEMTYIDGERNGSQKMFGPDGKIIKDEFIKAEPKSIVIPDKVVGDGQNGITKTYFASGELKSEVNYINGRMNGIAKTYFENGKLKSETPYLENKINGLVNVYNENGHIKSESQFTNGNLNGVVKEYYESGKLKNETTYENGKVKDGIYKSYYENEGTASATRYFNGEITGQILFYNNGQTLSEIPFKNEKMNGIKRTYYESGKLMDEMPWIDNKANGVQRTYSEETGHLIQEITWEDSKIIGEMRNYNDWIQDGKLVKLYKNGNISYEATFVNGQKEGHELNYYEGGDLKSKAFFENGVQKGVTKYYSPKKKNMTDQERMVHDQIMKEVRKQMIASLKNPQTWIDVAANVGQGIQQGAALNNMTKNPNSQTVSNYMQVTKNNYNKDLSATDALNANNKILNNSNNSSTTGNTPITDAYNKNIVKTNEIYNSSHPNNPINTLQGTVNYSEGSANVESSATTNNSSNNSGDGTCHQCDYITQNLRKNQNITTSNHEYDMAQIKLLDCTLLNCAKTQTDRDQLLTIRKQLIENYKNLGWGASINFGTAPASPNISISSPYSNPGVPPGKAMLAK